LPYGRWTLRVLGASLRSGSSWPVLTLSPVDVSARAGSVIIQ